MASVMQQTRAMYRVGRAWSKVPGWRLGQLVANAASAVTGQPDCDPFHVADEDLVQAIEEVADENRQR